jgi:hypothetical protein
MLHPQRRGAKGDITAVSLAKQEILELNRGFGSSAMQLPKHPQIYQAAVDKPTGIGNRGYRTKSARTHRYGISPMCVCVCECVTLGGLLTAEPRTRVVVFDVSKFFRFVRFWAVSWISTRSWTIIKGRSSARSAELTSHRTRRPSLQTDFLSYGRELHGLVLLDLDTLRNALFQVLTRQAPMHSYILCLSSCNLVMS